MSTISLFAPSPGETVAFDVTATTDRIALPSGTENGATVRVMNTGDGYVFIEWGDSSVEASVPTDGGAASSMPIAPTRESGFTIRGNPTHLAAICPASETATIYVTVGRGI